MITVENAAFIYPNADKPVMSGFSAQFRRGEITAVTGKNGCGKTTLTRLLVGMLRPSQGCVSIEGFDISDMDLFEIGQRVGYVFQNPNRQLFCDTAINEIAYGLRNSGLNEEETEAKANYYLDYFDLSQYKGTFPGKLSLGEKQRLALAAVLALGTDYIVLDEPTTGLDVRRQRDLGEILSNLRRELNCGVILVSHEAEFVSRYTDRELVMTR